jgi:division/cell wall cluster transcriptional repressor MraZ
MEKSEFPESPFFVGTHDGIVDGKGRINIPADFRHSLEESGESMLIFAPRAEFLYVFPQKTYVTYWKTDSRLRASLKRKGRFNADIAVHGNSYRKPVDSQGRVTLPKEAFERSGIKRDICFVGRLDFFIIRDKAVHDTYLEKDAIPSGDVWDEFEKIQETTEDE